MKGSAKFQAVLEEIRNTMAADRRVVNEAPSKFVVFSQFPEVLKKFESVLKRLHLFHHVCIAGQTSQAHREMALHSFRHDPSCRLILLSTGSASAGLTLTSANVLYMMEPCYSVLDEAQALNRCHRIGQTRRVRCVVFYAKVRLCSRIFTIAITNPIAIAITIATSILIAIAMPIAMPIAIAIVFFCVADRTPLKRDFWHCVANTTLVSSWTVPMHCVSVALTMSTMKRNPIAIVERTKEMVMDPKVSVSRTFSVFRRCRNSLVFCRRNEGDEMVMVMVMVLSYRGRIW